MLKHIAELFATEKTFSAPVPGAMRNMRWGALTRFLDDGTIELDNSPVECSIRPTVRPSLTGNALFAGSEYCSDIASVIETGKLNDVDLVP
jgi:Transposase IS66 family